MSDQEVGSLFQAQIPEEGLRHYAREKETKDSQYQRRNRRFDIDPTSLGAESFLDAFIADGLFGAVHLARAARGQSDSGLFASLGNSESSYPERQK